MSLPLIICAVCAFFLFSTSSDASAPLLPLVEFQWVSLNYSWDSSHVYEDYVSKKKFIPSNCLLAGVNVDVNGDIFVTVPRWKEGVPATLNKVDKNTNLLVPYPSWDMQVEGKSGDLQNVQSMTIDSKRRMWVIEVGRRNFFMGNPVKQVSGPAGLWTIDMATGSVTSKYYFPSNIVSYDAGFLNDIVIDEARDFAYLSDAWDKGAIIVFNIKTQTSRRFSGASTANDPSYSMVINGVNYGTHIFTTPTDGIAITPDGNALLYCQVQGTTLYRLRTDVLRDFSTTSSDVDAVVEVLGSKQPSDGIKYINGGLYWGSLTTSTYYHMPINSTSVPHMDEDAVAAPLSPDLMEWVDTFAVDLSTPNKLWFTSNRLDQFTTGSMDFTGKKGANMRIMSIVL